MAGASSAKGRSADPAGTKAVSAGELKKVLEDWLIRATTAQFGHQRKADRNRLSSIALGIPTVIISTVVGTAAFAAINDQSGDGVKVAVGIVSVVAAVLASIQTYLGYTQLAERHRVAAVRYAALRRDIEVALANPSADEVGRIRREMDKIGAVGPQIGARAWNKSKNIAMEELQGVPQGEQRTPASSSTAGANTEDKQEREVLGTTPTEAGPM